MFFPCEFEAFSSPQIGILRWKKIKEYENQFYLEENSALRGGIALSAQYRLPFIYGLKHNKLVTPAELAFLNHKET